MNKMTGLLRRAAAVAAFSGVAIALTTGTATAAEGTHHNRTEAECIAENSSGASDLSPSSRKAWASFICGAGQATGGAARMASGAWVGAPGLILMGATGNELSPAQKKAWVNWDGGAHQVGNGAALVVSGAYVGAPSIVMDKIMGGALPSELSDREMDQVSFLLPMDNAALDGLPVGAIPNPMAPLGSF
ncbi:type III effector [Nocardioides sp. NPDC047086]|uniref:type III effector n=1 Tax=Nocardioides sp. NPDC047086 TaxID=3154810 RepID=UPI0033F04435